MESNAQRNFHSELTRNFDNGKEISKESKEMRLSCDILKCFPRLICECVFQHLDAKELLQASEVNKEWYEFIGERPQIGKLKLSFSSLQELTDEVSDILKNSKRKYQNIEFKDISFLLSDFYLEFLAERAGSWKFVAWNNCEGEQSTLEEILGIIEPSIEDLVITNLYCSEYVETEAYPYLIPISVEVKNVCSEWTFKHLKTLEYINESYERYYAYDIFKYFLRCTNLVKLHRDLINAYETPTSKESLRTLLKHNRDLKDLRIIIDERFFEYSLEFTFKLRMLWVGIESFSCSIHLRLFLESQALTLESLRMQNIMDTAYLDLILGSMPRLTSLTVNFDMNYINWIEKLPVNTTITFLELEGYMGGNNPHHPYHILIKALPSLKHFKSTDIYDKILLALSQNGSDLESIETESFGVSRFPVGDAFPKIKKFKAERFKKGMQQPVDENRFTALVKNEMGKKLFCTLSEE